MSPPQHINSLAPHQALRVQRFEAPFAHQATSTAVHPHATLCLVLRGAGQFWMDCAYRLQPGHLVLVPAGLAHGLQESQDLKLLGLSICGSSLVPPWGGPLGQAFEAVQTGASAVRVLGARRGWVQEILERLQGDLDGGTAAAALSVQGAMCQLTAELLRAAPLPSLPPQSTQWVAQALAFLQRHATRGVGLQEVAEHVGRSPTHVASTIKARTGRTVMQWVTDARMSTSRSLLSQSDANVEEVARRSGYKSPSHFQRSFKRAHGVSAGQWRSQQRAQR